HNEAAHRALNAQSLPAEALSPPDVCVQISATPLLRRRMYRLFRQESAFFLCFPPPNRSRAPHLVLPRPSAQKTAQAEGFSSYYCSFCTPFSSSSTAVDTIRF